VQQRAVDLALEHARVQQIEKALDQHLAHAVEAELERRALAQTRGRAIAGIEPRRERAKVRVAPMPQDERVRHRVAERSDAELQGAAVGHRARHVHPGGVVGELDGLARRREQAKVRGRAFQHQVEFARGDVAVAGHERQLRIDLSDEEKVALLARAAREQIEREVGVAAEAETSLAAAHALGDELRHHVDAAVEHVPQRVGVVGADVALLRGGDAEPRAGREEELVDLDVRRQRARVQRERVVELGIAGEHAVRDRLEKAPFEVALAARLLQGERGEDAQLDRGIGGRALKQRVGDVIGLAEAERHRQLDIFADAFDDRVGHTIRIFERDGRAATTCQVIPNPTHQLIHCRPRASGDP